MLKNPRFWIAFFSMFGVLSLAIVSIGKSSPGPLASVHEREAQLVGRGSCSECHGGWTRSMASACLDCHAPIEEQLAAASGLHGTLEKEVARQCAVCHSDHHGTEFALVNRISFLKAGIPDPSEFDHGLIGFVMNGRHLELECSECHANAEALVLPQGEPRFLGLDRNCATCHEDPHQGRMKLACAQCHGQVDFQQLDSIDHDEQLPLIGSHGDIGCRECHAEGAPRSLESIGAASHGLAARECIDCHESPHEDLFTNGVAELASTSRGAACVACHAAEHESFREDGLTVSAEHHALSGFPLDAPHDEAGCRDCHDVGLATFEERYPDRGANDCHLCHEDVHEGQFADSFFGRDGCLDCHERHAFDPHTFNLEKHSFTDLALTGTHADTDCYACHELPESGAARVFHGTPGRCEDCHADAHRDYFDDHLELAEPVAGGECAHCHLTTTFSELPETGFQHGLWTGFPVVGAHEQTACESCHERTPEPDDLGRTFGWISEHYGAFESCSTCHADPHGGTFDPPKLRAEVGGRTSCGRCHNEVSWRTFERELDHGRWTGFELKQAHAELACSACHAPLRAVDELGRTMQRARGPLCSDCHVDPHAGQFRESGRTDCQRCHSGDVGFAGLSFDHQTDSRFPLSEAHQGVACTACHTLQTLASGSKVVRYKPLETDCASCHGSPESPAFRRKRTKN